MPEFNIQSQHIPKVLATDLDGTLIPLPGNEENVTALSEIAKAHREKKFSLTFITGRHYTSVLTAMEEHHLPNPEWMICDVGTTIHHLEDGTYPELRDYADHLLEITGQTTHEQVMSIFMGLPDLQLQQEDHQRPFKISYECPADKTEHMVSRMAELLEDFKQPYNVHGSIDPFENCGLIDLLPKGVSKAYAVKWLANYLEREAGDVVVAGDSGNDLPSLTCGCRAILVANASEGLEKKVKNILKKKNKTHVLYVAKKKATSGVLEGCRHFKWI